MKTRMTCLKLIIVVLLLTLPLAIWFSYLSKMSERLNNSLSDGWWYCEEFGIILIISPKIRGHYAYYYSDSKEFVPLVYSQKFHSNVVDFEFNNGTDHHENYKSVAIIKKKKNEIVCRELLHTDDDSKHGAKVSFVRYTSYDDWKETCMEREIGDDGSQWR